MKGSVFEGVLAHSSMDELIAAAADKHEWTRRTNEVILGKPNTYQPKPTQRRRPKLCWPRYRSARYLCIRMAGVMEMVLEASMAKLAGVNDWTAVVEEDQQLDVGDTS